MKLPRETAFPHNSDFQLDLGLFNLFSLPFHHFLSPSLFGCSCSPVFPVCYPPDSPTKSQCRWMSSHSPPLSVLPADHSFLKNGRGDDGGALHREESLQVRPDHVNQYSWVLSTSEASSNKVVGMYFLCAIPIFWNLQTMDNQSTKLVWINANNNLHTL